MADDEFTAVETYVRSSQYPKGRTMGEKANLRRKCRNVIHKKDGIDEASKWKICVRSDDEKRRILESCHSGHREKTRRILFDCENDFTIDLFDLLMI